jgi:hypothetical protein
MFSKLKTRGRDDFRLRIADCGSWILDFRSGKNLIIEHHAGGTKII